MTLRLFAAVALLCVSMQAQTDVAPILQPHSTFVDASGSPCASCSLYSYTAGTTTFQPTYTDASGAVQNTNPIVLSPQGGADIWPDKRFAYKFVLKNPQGTTIWTVDYVQSPGSTSIVSDPTGTQTITQPPGTNFNVNTSVGGKFNYNGSEVVNIVTGVIKSPTATQVVTQPPGTTLSVNNFNSVQYVRDGDNLATLCSQFTSSTGQLIISAPINIAASQTVPATCGVIIYKGGTVTIASGQTLTINSPFVAPTAQVFFGAGTAVGFTEVRPDWFGSATTISAAVGKLASGIKGSILLGASSYPAGSQITRSSVNIIGVGEAAYSGGNTAFASGTGSIVVGNLAINASSISVRNLSVDVGSAQGACNNGLSISGGVIATPIADVTVDHVSTLLCNAASPFHSVLIENVTRGLISNVQTRFGIYGLVLKCKDCSVSHIVSSGHGTNCGIVKSDTQFGVSSGVNLSDIKCRSIGDHDTGPFNIDGFGAAVTEATVDGFSAINTKGGLLYSARFDGTTEGSVVDSMLSNIWCDGLTVGPCLQTVSTTTSNVARLLVTNIGANNVAGDAVSLATGTTGVSLVGGSFTNITIGYPIDNAAEGTMVSNIHCFNHTLPCFFANANHAIGSNVIADGTVSGVGSGAIALTTYDPTQNSVQFTRLSVGAGTFIQNSGNIPLSTDTAPTGTCTPNGYYTATLNGVTVHIASCP